MILYSVQIFRGVASLLVVLSHAQMHFPKNYFLHFFAPGASGVIFFFVLSGFIIFRSYGGVANLNIMKYLKNRFNRIYPVYWIYTIIFLALSYLQNYLIGEILIDSSNFSLGSWLKSITLFPFSKTPGDWPFIPPAWSLSYEIFFYLLFAYIFYYKNLILNLIICVYLLCIFLFSFRFVLIDFSYPVNFIFNSYILLFIIGGLSYYALEWCKSRNEGEQKWIMRISVLLGISLLVIAWFDEVYGWNVTNKVGGSLPLFGLGYVLILSAGVLYERFLVPSKIQGTIVKFFTYCGDASYSIYLVHFWVLAIFLRSFSSTHVLLGDYLYFLVIFTLTLAICLISYQFIERPILTWLHTRYIVKKN
jgi:exopolysaccharide production protein ExoZ